MFIYILNFNVNTGIYGNLPFFSLQEQRPNNPDYTPGIAFIIVSKHINTRFFKMDQHGMGSNQPCGTVVDNKITLNERFDFLSKNCIEFWRRTSDDIWFSSPASATRSTPPRPILAGASPLLAAAPGGGGFHEDASSVTRAVTESLPPRGAKTGTGVVPCPRILGALYGQRKKRQPPC